MWSCELYEPSITRLHGMEGYRVVNWDTRVHPRGVMAREVGGCHEYALGIIGCSSRGLLKL